MELFRLYEVDSATWENGPEVPQLLSAKVDRAADADMVMSGKLEVDADSLPVGYYRLMRETIGQAGVGRDEIATLYVSAPKKTHKATGQTTIDAECYSVLRPADAKVLKPGWTFPRDSDPVIGALSLVASVVSCPVTPVESDVRTKCHIVAEQGETALSMARYLLSVAGYRLTIDGHGTVSAEPVATAPVATLDARNNDAITGDVDEELDLYDVPNVVMMTDSDGKLVEARNEDAESPTSVQAIGFEVCSFEKPTLADGETLLGKAFALLDEASATSHSLKYTRDYDAEIREGDVVSVHLPQFGIDGSFRISSQSIDIGHGAMVTETAVAVVDTFAR